MLYDQKATAWGWGGHGDNSLGNGRPLKKQRHNSSLSYGSFVKPLVRLVQESWDTVGVLSDSFNDVALSSSKGNVARKVNGLTVEQRRLIQEERLNSAKALEHWTQAAEELDRLDGCDVWKKQDGSTDYDAQTLRDKIAELESARDNEDLERMLRLIRTSLSREVAGIGNPKLYQHSRIGTKDLIERYVVTAVDVIESATRLAAICSMDAGRSQQVKQDMLDTRQAYGRTALLLSGGGTFGMMHIGVVKAMFEAGVLPRVVSGTSAGSIVAAVLCTRKDDEMPDVIKDFCHGDLSVFSKPGTDESLGGKLQRFWSDGQVYDIKHLEDVMKGHLGDMTFQEAYNRTQRILCIAVSSVEEQDEPVLLSYATTPNVIIRSAVSASCSVPGIYASAGLVEKCPHTSVLRAYGSDMHRFIDGSISHDLPLVRLQEMYDVNHFIVSQVNPHVVPFLRQAAAHYGSNARPEGRWWDSTLRTAKDEVVRRLGDAAELAEWVPHEPSRKAVRTTCHITRSILEQQYTGDITILPDTLALADWLTILSNPTPEFMARAMEKGERATWPEIDRIRKRTAVEHALDSSVRSTLERVAFSPSQVELRLGRMRKPATRGRRLRGRRCMTPDHTNTTRAEPAPHRTLQRESTGAGGKCSTSMSLTESGSSRDQSSRSPSPAQQFFNSSTSPMMSSTDDTDEDEYLLALSVPITHVPSGTVSLPATPFREHRRFPFTDSPESPKGPLSPTLTMTPSPAVQKTSEPEQMYKRLFHEAGVLPARNHTGSLKRNESTGRMGLRPPERQ